MAGLGALRILDAIRISGLEKKTCYYQASTSELYGEVQETPQRETTPFYSRSPYDAYWIIKGAIIKGARLELIRGLIRNQRRGQVSHCPSIGSAIICTE